MTNGQLVTIAANEQPSVFLFAAPWMKAGWPCLGIGSLKSFLGVAGIPVRCSHFYLEIAAHIGWMRYDGLAETWGAGEALLGALLDPDDSARLVSVAVQLLRDANQPEAAKWAENSACDDLRKAVDAWLERERPYEYAIVGGSVGAMQLCSSLYLIKRVRERGHSGWRILGGSGLVGSVSREVLARCPDIHAVVDGEGEHAMLAIAQRVRCGAQTLSGLPRVLTRDSASEDEGCAASTVDLAAASAANLDEYYDSAKRLGIPKTALTLSFEYSRGCEWEHRTKDRLRGCTFCGLYRNSPDHRRKPVEKVLREIEDGIQRYRILDLAFVDAYMPPNYRDELLDGLARLPADISIFTEMRCDVTRETAERLAQRARRIQLGVESFSNAILRRIGKGTKVAHTVYSVRVCQEYGINLQYNLMTHIPGVPATEIDKLHDFLPILFGLVPPSIAVFYLDRNSLIFSNPQASGIDIEGFDLERPAWLAQSLGDSRITQVVPFTSVDPTAKEAWERVATQVAQWQERSCAAKLNGINSLLTWRDGDGWASVLDARNSVAHIYTLEGALYDVFVASNEVISERGLRVALHRHSAEMIAEALQQLVRRDLILRDGQYYVSLPVRSRGRRAAIQPRGGV